MRKKSSKKKYIRDNSLLMAEWNYEKNISLNLLEITTGCNKKVWWKCSKCGYEWESKVSNRAVLKRGCPLCSNKVVVVGKNDLATTHPEIAAEWHPSKNGNLTPQQVTHGTGRKVWWSCPEGHEYQATVLHRTQGKGTNCPICNGKRRMSFAEQAVYFYVKKFFPDAIHGFKADFLNRMELDVYIPSIKYAIEYDGEAWHTNERLKIEEHKYQLCREQGIHLMRVREKMPPSFSFMADWMISYGNKKEHVYDKDKIGGIIIEVLRKLSMFNAELHKQLLLGYCAIDVLRDRFKIMEGYKIKLTGDTLQNRFPKIAKEWHPTKNGKLKPNMFRCGAEDRVWWVCGKCGYEFEQTIAHRTAKNHPTGCPKCGIKKSALAKSKAVNMLDPNTHKILKTFISISEAGREMQINNSNITMVCKGIRPKAGGYCWEYTAE